MVNLGCPHAMNHQRDIAGEMQQLWMQTTCSSCINAKYLERGTYAKSPDPPLETEDSYL